MTDQPADLLDELDGAKEQAEAVRSAPQKTVTASDLLAGGAVSAKFPEIGTTVAGTVLEVQEPQQQRDFDSNAPLFWDDGNPRMMLPVEVQTELTEDEDDDGIRCFYLKGNMLKAVKSALRSARVKTLEEGGTLSVTYYDDGPKPRKGYAPKLYKATYTPPQS